MNVSELLAHLRELGVSIKAEGDDLHVEAPVGVLTPEIIATLRNQKAAITARLARCYRPGGSYGVRSFAVRQSPPGLADWAERSGYKRAGVITAAGETVLGSGRPPSP